MRPTLKILELLYTKYNKVKYIHPDPLEFVYNYNDNTDREIVGLLASSLAYGNVKQILKSVSSILYKMGNSPYLYIVSGNRDKFLKDYKFFKHRFTTGEEIVKLLLGIQYTILKYSSLNNFFIYCLKSANNNFINAVSEFTIGINIFFAENKSYLIASPVNKSACKRLMLYFRWMIRKDEVDPGCWNNSVSPSILVIPLDTHMYNISLQFDLTERKTADLKAALEITEKFKLINKNDPVKYDFTLTRFGIRKELTYKDITSS